jgi:hypothetical protein
MLANPTRLAVSSRAFRLKQALDGRDKAVVRLTWTTTRIRSTGAIETTEDEGLDVFRRSTDGR